MLQEGALVRVMGLVLVVLLAAVPAGAQKSKIVYFNWFFDPVSNATELEIIKDFEAAHPSIEVEKQVQPGADAVWEKALVMAAGGVAPDVVCVSLAVGLSARRSGMLLDLAPYIQRDKFDMKRFRPGYELTLGPDWAWGGKAYGFPWGLGILNTFYNRDMFRAAGLQEPYKGWTKAEYLNAARRLTQDRDGDGKPDIIGSAAPNVYYSPWVFLDGGDFADPATGKLTVEEPKFVSALEWIRHVLTNYPVFGGYMDEFFASGLAMTYQWDSFINILLKRDLPFDWSATWAPRGDMSDPISYGQGHVMSIMTGSKHPEAAWQFMRFYYSATEQRRLAEAFLYPMTQEGMRAVMELVNFPAPLNKAGILEPYSNVGTLKTVPWWVAGVTEALNKGSGTFGKVISGAMSVPQWIEEFKAEVAAAAAALK